MKVVYHEKYKEVYSDDPAAEAGRIECICAALAGEGEFEFVEPAPATEADVRLVHTQRHVEAVKELGLFNPALLAVGGAIAAAQLAFDGEPAFGLIRPPGHHASPNRCWGFCYFNNTAISVEKLRRAGLIRSALILDFDLHYGDGTANFFAAVPKVSYYHVPDGTRGEQLRELERYLASKEEFEILAVSAGFDRHVEDWGGTLETEDYRALGALIKEHAARVCGGKRFAVLEGGYNHAVLGKNVRAFLAGMS
jgi:acetoin utilization deacetylase AcuC-like enzyme